MQKRILQLAIFAIGFITAAVVLIASKHTVTAAIIENASEVPAAGLEAGQPEVGQHSLTLPATGMVAGPEIYYTIGSLRPIKNFSISSRLYAGYRWGPMSIIYNISKDGLNVPASFYDAVRNAVAFWESLSQGKLEFQEAGSAEEADLDIIFDTNYLAEHGKLGEANVAIGYVGALPYAVSAEVRINSPTNECSAFWQAAHEIGHVLGLSHSNDEKSIMYGYGETCIAGAGQDVESAIKELFVDFPDKPDLRVSYVQGLRIGSKLHLWYDIANIGVKDSQAFDASVAGSNGDVIGQLKFKNMAPGKREQGRAEFALPEGAIYVSLIFTVDSSNLVEEIDESDNSVEMFAEISNSN